MNTGNFLPVDNVKARNRLAKLMKIVPFFWHGVCELDYPHGSKAWSG
jgi:hypothetical protein